MFAAFPLIKLQEYPRRLHVLITSQVNGNVSSCHKEVKESEIKYSVQEKDYTGWGIWEHSNFDKNAVPKDDRPLYGMSAWTAIVFPGMHLSSGPDCGGGNICYRNEKMLEKNCTEWIKLGLLPERTYSDDNKSVCCRLWSDMSTCTRNIADIVK